MKKREEYFLNTIRHWHTNLEGHFFGVGERPSSLEGIDVRSRYYVTKRWSLKAADYDGFYIPLVLTALKRDKRGVFSIHMPNRILDLLKMAAFPEIIE